MVGGFQGFLGFLFFFFTAESVHAKEGESRTGLDDLDALRSA